MARLSTISTARTAPRALWSSEELSVLTDAVGVMELVLLHGCRFGQALYDWHPTAMVGRFMCRGCGVVGECGACAELRGQRISPGIVPALCALHGGLLEIGITDVALAVDFPAPVAPRCRPARVNRTQLKLLPSSEPEQRKEDAERTTNQADMTAP
jgi:hypothetical protein